MHYRIMADGACPGNGQWSEAMYISFAVYSGEELLHHTNMEQIFSKETPTNNKAEALALYTALLWLQQHDILTKGNTIEIVMDSELVLRQITGVYKTKNKFLLSTYKLIHEVLNPVWSDVKFKWVSGKEMKQSVIGH